MFFSTKNSGCTDRSWERTSRPSVFHCRNPKAMTTEKHVELSIILPTYNESGNILLLLDELEKHIRVPYEAIVVDDNSPDGTWRLVGEYAESHSQVVLVHRTQERGLTSAINAGLDRARGQLL